MPTAETGVFLFQTQRRLDMNQQPFPPTATPTAPVPDDAVTAVVSDLQKDSPILSDALPPTVTDDPTGSAVACGESSLGYTSSPAAAPAQDGPPAPDESEYDPELDGE
jgi:hypothetical protein